MNCGRVDDKAHGIVRREAGGAVIVAVRPHAKPLPFEGDVDDRVVTGWLGDVDRGWHALLAVRPGQLDRLRANAEDHVAGLRHLSISERNLDPQFPPLGDRAAAVGLQRGGQEIHRRRAEETGHEPVRWSLIDRLGRIDLLGDAVLEDDDLRAERLRLDLVMRDIDRGNAEVALERLEGGASFHPQLGVQRAERLVEQEELRLADECAAEGNPLLLATRELVREPVQQSFHL
jgi:hypothetical protein